MAGNKYITNAAGVLTEVHASQTSAGAADAGKLLALNSAGLVDQTAMPVGVGPDTAAVVASEALAAGAYVNIWSNAGVFNVRNADGSTQGKEADGFVLTSVASGATATVYFAGTNNAVTGQTPGPVYLSATTAGAGSATAANAAGQTAQKLGTATSATSVNVNILQPVNVN